MSANGTAAVGSMSLNPHIQYYSTVYVVSMGAALLLKTVRGLVFVKVSPSTSPPPPPPPDNNIHRRRAVKWCSCLIVFASGVVKHSRFSSSVIEKGL